MHATAGGTGWIAREGGKLSLANLHSAARPNMLFELLSNHPELTGLIARWLIGERGAPPAEEFTGIAR